MGRKAGRDRRIPRQPSPATIAVFLNVPYLPMPEAYSGDVANRLDEKGALSDKSTREFFQKFMTAYAEWVGLNREGHRAKTLRQRTEVNLFE
jgi:hypothetical protein